MVGTEHEFSESTVLVLIIVYLSSSSYLQLLVPLIKHREKEHVYRVQGMASPGRYLPSNCEDPKDLCLCIWNFQGVFKILVCMLNKCLLFDLNKYLLMLKLPTEKSELKTKFYKIVRGYWCCWFTIHF